MKKSKYAGGSLSRSGLDAAEVKELVEVHGAVFGSLSRASILITGATGWFGVWLLDCLLAADDILNLGIKITAVSRDPNRFLKHFKLLGEDSRIQWISSDVTRLESSLGEFSHIIHGAADTGASRDSASLLRTFETILSGTSRVIEIAEAGCRSMLLLSSGAIYGPCIPGNRSFTESGAGGPDPSHVKSAYAEGKRAAELIAALAVSRGVPIRIARCFAFVGAHMPFDKHFAIGNFIADAVEGREIQVKSDGRPLRSYLYMTDLVRSLLMILCDGKAGQPYNVGSESSMTIKDLAQCVNKVIGGSGVRIDGDPTRWDDHYVPDTSRIQLDLNFRQEVDIETAIARTAAWYRAQSNKSLT
jgi:nucleoside-diphosphate-sugar epimerase